MGSGKWGKRWAAGLLAILAIQSSSIVHGQEMDLKRALVGAYLSNPDLTLAQAQLRAVDEQLPQALAGWRPSLFVNGDLTAVDSASNISDSSNASAGTSLDVSQNLYAGGATVAGVRRAENDIQAERAALIAIEQEVLLSAVDSYTSTFQDRSVLQLAINNADRLERQLQATRDRFEVGEVARTDVAQAEARLADARANIQVATSDLAASEAFFRDIIGSDPGELAEPEELAIGIDSLDLALEIARMNPDIVEAEHNVRSARDDVDIAKSDLLPELDLFGSLSLTESPSDTVDFSRSASIGLDLSVPLYQGGAAYSRVREAIQLVRVQQSNLEGTIRGVQRGVASAWQQLTAARAAADALRTQVRANEIALEGVEQEALVGQRTVLDVLDAEQELFESQVDLVSAERTAVLASAELKSAIGELTAASLELDTPFYDPLANYNRQRSRLFGIGID